MVVSRQGERVVVEGFRGTCWLTAAGLHGTVRRSALDRALSTGDADALYRMNPEFVPAWCPTCGASYCQVHWDLEMVVADDHPGWYEATYGTCPEGHRRKIDD